MVEPAGPELEDGSGEEPRLIDGETGPPSIAPPNKELPQPPVSSRFVQA